MTLISYLGSAEPRYDIKVKNLNIADIKPINYEIYFKFLGAVLRSAQMIGAMEKVLDLSTNYCSERQQFGRALPNCCLSEQ